MRWPNSLFRLFFNYFYHQFAWTYDSVAQVVSIGRWNLWVQAAIPFLAGRDILEVGFGPGHLQAKLLASAGLNVAGIDESRQMAALARRRLNTTGLNRGRLTRGLAQALPFRTRAFDTVVSTFPSEYIFDPTTLSEIHRVLRGRGRLVIVPASWIVGRSMTDRAAAWLFQVTHQAPPSLGELLSQRLEGILEPAGFLTSFETVEIRSSLVFVVTASKTSDAKPSSGLTR